MGDSHVTLKPAVPLRIHADSLFQCGHRHTYQHFKQTNDGDFSGSGRIWWEFGGNFLYEHQVTSSRSSTRVCSYRREIRQIFPR